MSISPGFSPGISTQPVNKGGTGATTASGARSNLGLAASTTDNAICRFDGTSGSTQNSGCTIDDSGNLTVSGTGGHYFGAPASGTALTIRHTGATKNPGLYFGNNESTGASRIAASGSSGPFSLELAVANDVAATLTSTATTLAGSLTVSGSQNVLGVPASANALTTNSTMTFELTSNTSLTIRVRGTDGTTRSVSLTLA